MNPTNCTNKDMVNQPQKVPTIVLPANPKRAETTPVNNTEPIKTFISNLFICNLFDTATPYETYHQSLSLRT